MHSPLLVFLVGGAVCLIAQLLIDLTKLTPARILVLYVCLGVLLYGTGIYTPIYDFAGAGISVPLLGFGANIARGVKEAIDKNGAVGILSGGLEASAIGITVALLLGLFISIFVKGKPKKM